MPSFNPFSMPTENLDRRILSSSIIRWTFLAVVITKVVATGNYSSKANAPNGTNIIPNQCHGWSDQFVGNSQKFFDIIDWIRRGLCVRADNTDAKCYATLIDVLGVKLNELRKAEYSGAAGVLALLPTIGALLGAPTNEIWRLLTLVPFGGVLSMFISFGGAILPVKVRDYEMDFSKRRRGRNTTIGEIEDDRVRGPLPDTETDAESEHHVKHAKIKKLKMLVKERLQQSESRHLPIKYIWVGLCGMALLLFAAHAAMAIVEQGAVLPWWCTSKWWMHLWYFMVTSAAIVDNWVQLPFKNQWKLFVSDIPYNVQVDGGEDITTWLKTSNEEAEVKGKNSVEVALSQLGTLGTGAVTLHGSRKKALSRNSIIVMVSVTDDSSQRINSFLKACSKLSSIGVFATGTAFFASAQLLALPMAVMAITMVLAAGVFGRTIAGWIVTGVEQCEPMVHFIANTTSEASEVIQAILTMEPTIDEEEGQREDKSTAYISGSTAFMSGMEIHSAENAGSVSSMNKGPPTTMSNFRPIHTRKFQVEIQGHIFIDKQRVLRRSVWPLRVLGIMAKPYDIGSYRP